MYKIEQDWYKTRNFKQKPIFFSKYEIYALFCYFTLLYILIYTMPVVMDLG